MTLDANILRAGDHALLVELGSTPVVHFALRSWIDSPPDGVEEMVAGAVTILLIGDPDPVEVESRITALSMPPDPPPGRLHTIPAVYDGPDLAELAAQTGLSASEIAAAHRQTEYLVAFMGFSPGFAYLTGTDPRLHIPRRPTPRTAVPAGSVALAAGMTAVYPQATPGGWWLVGRTDAVMFDPARREPAVLSPGDRVRFEAAPFVDDPPATYLRSVPPEPVPNAPAVEVMDPGPLLTIQDGGRRGWGHVGVSAGGAADRRSAIRANLLVGNPPDASLLESTLGSCQLRLRARRRIAITGAPADLSVDGLPARSDVPLELQPGTEIRIGPCRAGVRVYVAISGGFDVPPMLGSRSTDTLSGLGPAPLGARQVLPLGRPGGIPVRDVPPPVTPLAPGNMLVVEARLGPRQDWLSSEGRDTLEAGELEVKPSSDRVGVRLGGTPVSRSQDGEIASEGMVPGAIQIPPDGQPIVLMRNHPPTGGYPVVAVVTDDGVDALAQAPPGTRVRFDLCDP